MSNAEKRIAKLEASVGAGESVLVVLCLDAAGTERAIAYWRDPGRLDLRREERNDGRALLDAGHQPAKLFGELWMFDVL
jgi:hypothetical protein